MAKGFRHISPVSPPRCRDLHRSSQLVYDIDARPAGEKSSIAVDRLRSGVAVYWSSRCASCAALSWWMGVVDGVSVGEVDASLGEGGGDIGGNRRASGETPAPLAPLHVT